MALSRIFRAAVKERNSARTRRASGGAPGPHGVATSLNNPAVLTAWSNDYSFETVFARQAEAYSEASSVLLGISTSGNSGNVVEAFRTARDIGMTTVGLTGAGGGKLALLSDVLIDVPSRHTPEIQQVHICLYHYICEAVEARCAT